MTQLPGNFDHQLAKENVFHRRSNNDEAFVTSCHGYTTYSGESSRHKRDSPVGLSRQVVHEGNDGQPISSTQPRPVNNGDERFCNSDVTQSVDRLQNDKNNLENESDQSSVKCMVCTSKITSQDLDSHLLFGTLKCSTCHLFIGRCNDIWKSKNSFCVGKGHTFKWDLIKFGESNNVLQCEYNILKTYLSVTKGCKNSSLYEFAYNNFDKAQKYIIGRISSLKNRAKTPKVLSSLSKETRKNSFLESAENYQIIKHDNCISESENVIEKLVLKKVDKAPEDCSTENLENICPSIDLASQPCDVTDSTSVDMNLQQSGDSSIKEDIENHELSTKEILNNYDNLSYRTASETSTSIGTTKQQSGIGNYKIDSVMLGKNLEGSFPENITSRLPEYVKNNCVVTLKDRDYCIGCSADYNTSTPFTFKESLDVFIEYCECCGLYTVTPRSVCTILAQKMM